MWGTAKEKMNGGKGGPIDGIVNGSKSGDNGFTVDLIESYPCCLFLYSTSFQVAK